MATSQAIAIPIGGGTQERIDAAKRGILKTLEQANKELWLLLSLFVIMAMMNFLVDSQRMVLGFYTFPTVFSAYSYGRRHATLTAFASVLLVVLFTYFNPAEFQQATSSAQLVQSQWLGITVWGGTLILIGYLMGSLYEHQKSHLEDLRSTYQDVLMILRHFISKDKYIENHSYRVSVYATKIAGSLANVFIKLDGSFPQSPVPTASVTIDQRGCIYSPRMVGVRIGQTLAVRNNDALMHNVHGVSGAGNGFNVSQPKAGMVRTFRMMSEETVLRLRCDVHGWMTAYIGVVSHPYFAVSDADGAFEITGVPVGSYTIRTWHERYGPLTQTVSVRAVATTPVDVEYTGNETPPTAGVRDLLAPVTAVHLASR